MPFDPAKPADGSLIVAAELRNQFTAVKALVDAQTISYGGSTCAFLPASCGGGVLLEAIIATAVVALFLSGVHLTNSQVLHNVRASLESVAATRNLTARAEQLRASTWSQVTNADFLKNNILNAAANSNSDLGNLVETIEITAYLAPWNSVQPIQVQRAANGTVAVVYAGDGTMPNQTSVRIDITSAWTGKGNRARTRQMTLIVGQGGVLGRS